MKKLLAQTNVVLVTRLIATALLLSAVGSCSDRQMPTALEANKSSNKQIAPVIDWYSCWKYESDTEWRECNYTGTTGENNGPSWVDFTDPYYYTSLQQVAVTSNPYAVEPQPHAYLPDMSDRDTISSLACLQCVAGPRSYRIQGWWLGIARRRWRGRNST